MVRLGLAALAATLIVAGAAVAPAGAARDMQLGIFDDAQTLAHPATTFATLKELHVQVVRITLDWRNVARRRPASPADPLEPACDWTAYDTAVQTAAEYGIRPLLTIRGTPAWANAGGPANQAATNMQSLAAFRHLRG